MNVWGIIGVGYIGLICGFVFVLVAEQHELKTDVFKASLITFIVVCFVIAFVLGYLTKIY
jgi:uncharacterized membrane protein